MNRKISILISVIITGLLISSCQKDTSPVITQTFELEIFNGLELSMAGNVRIIEGVNQKVEITGPEETVLEIIKTVESGIWNISLPNYYNKSYDELNIVITSNEIEHLVISGSGNISGDYTLPLSSVAISGSGNINVKTETTRLNSEISGSGNITISGNADTLEHFVSGSGNFNGFTLETTDTKITITGSGNSEVFVTNSLDVEISGSGNVYYKGRPSITTDISGSGQLIDAN
ncbi:MAG: head GIN domain-containing protein [Bacteroidota bacterium]|nr:head GIN domain-containing protein [Bacteroidota bacterium]